MISVGMARGAFEYALQYSKEGLVGGKPLIKHRLISAQGMAFPRLLAFFGAAISLTRHKADSESAVSLLMPAKMTTFFTPKAIARVRFPMPSTSRSRPLSRWRSRYRKNSHSGPV